MSGEIAGGLTGPCSRWFLTESRAFLLLLVVVQLSLTEFTVYAMSYVLQLPFLSLYVCHM